MQQIMNITDVRKNLSSIVADIAASEGSVVIVRDSRPEAVLYPYQKMAEDIKEKEKLWKMKLEKLLAGGKKAGKAWAKNKRLNVEKMTEEKKYALVKSV